MGTSAVILNFVIIILDFGATTFLNLKEYGRYAQYLNLTLTSYYNETAILAIWRLAW
jgi:hypothetical protein